MRFKLVVTKVVEIPDVLVDEQGNLRSSYDRPDGPVSAEQHVLDSMVSYTNSTIAKTLKADIKVAALQQSDGDET